MSFSSARVFSRGRTKKNSSNHRVEKPKPDCWWLCKYLIQIHIYFYFELTIHPILIIYICIWPCIVDLLSFTLGVPLFSLYSLPHLNVYFQVWYFQFLKASIDEIDRRGWQRGQRRFAKEPAEEVDGCNCGSTEEEVDSGNDSSEVFSQASTIPIVTWIGSKSALLGQKLFSILLSCLSFYISIYILYYIVLCIYT